MPKTKAKPRTGKPVRLDLDAYKMVEKCARREQRTIQFVTSRLVRAGFEAEGGKPSGEVHTDGTL